MTGPNAIARQLDRQAPALVGFVRAMSPDEAEQAMASDAGLLAGAYDHALDDLINKAESAQLSALVQRRALLRMLREDTGLPTVQQLCRIAIRAGRRAAEDPGTALLLWQRVTANPGLSALPPQARVQIFNQLGIAHARVPPADEHEPAALSAFEQAVALAEASGEDASEFRFNAVEVRLRIRDRTEQGPPGDDVTAARTAVEQAIGPARRTGALVHLGDVHRLRFAADGRTEDLEAAAVTLQEALREAQQDKEGCETAAGALQRLARAAFRRYEGDGRLDLLDRAAALMETALRATPANAAEYPPRASDLGMLLRERFQHRADPADLWRAVEALRTAVRRSPPGDPEQAGRSMNLGNALTQLYELTGRELLLAEGLRVLEQAIDRFPAGDPERAGCISAVSRNLRIRYARHGDRADLDRSLRLDAEALDAVPAGRPERAMLLFNAANGLARSTARIDDSWRKAVTLWREGSADAAERDPALVLNGALNWLPSALRRDAHGDAVEAAGHAQNALGRLVTAQDNRRGQEDWLSAARRLPGWAAQAHLGAGDPERAVLAVERSRASLFAQQLHRSEAGTPDVPALHDLARRVGPFAYLVPADRDPLGLVVDGDGVRALPLPELTEDAVTSAMQRLYRGYFHRRADPDGWRDVFDEVAGWLWTAAMGPLLDRVPAGGVLQLLPGGLLGTLPLHAAWTPDPTLATGRRYACDEAVLTLLPGASVLRTDRTRGRRLLTVADPAPTSEPPLRWAAVETVAAGTAFGTTVTLRDADATPERVLARAVDADVVHFACHGRTEMDSPLGSGLVLAGDRVLTVAALLAAGMPVRLVVASACESAFVHPRVPDEVVSLSAGLLYAGADAVLASGFAVDDLTAFLLTTRFYDRWRPGATGPQALREAACFVRDTTNTEKLFWVRQLAAEGWPHAVTEALAGPLGIESPGERSFAAPADWAAFTWWGSHVRA
ncbi:CHAT domain-containing protein [Actinoplanes palleronii]|uniref:CHAT domain-containing protein n=1 Tax=Actinoplanes palleronii TaxID=113570 RepID=A0ABQ4BHV1_9ACTN|nr:CHAT domain-containing protein [Actinoplanes palleronii]GIE70200.1 hypothetical protein Apa02nite_063080 [Actinoplanes palleronii]